jgi:hypothetical protein
MSSSPGLNPAAPQHASSLPDKPRKTWALRLFVWLLAAFAILVIVFGLAVLNNNYSIHQPSRAEFTAQLDRAIDSSTSWIVQHPENYGNPSVMFMIGDMAEMSRDPRLQQYVQGYLASDRVRVPGQPITWYYARLVDQHAEVPILTHEPPVGFELLWDTYATAPDRMQLSTAQRSDMFSTNKYVWGLRDHQLLALDIYRHFNGTSPELNQTIKTVSDGVAGDAYWDFRLTDAYYQRSAFVLAADRPELVRSRWIERILDHQHPDGYWSYCWYGWCRGILEFSLQDTDPGHPTVQAAWALYMLKYRYEDWIDHHYHS